jgi:drug/metabolite transporter (DMT)-like permease
MTGVLSDSRGEPIILGELPLPSKYFGVALIVAGSLAMHRRLFAQGLLAPAKAVIRENGSHYMLLVSLIFSVTNTLDKKLVTMSDIFTEAFAYALGLSISFWIMGRVRRSDFSAAARGNWKWISLAATLDAVSLIFQLASYAYIAIVITVSIKRAGIVLSVLAGWLFFHERNITDKVIAASVMFCGVLILYLPLSPLQALLVTVVTLAGMSLSLYVTRNEKQPAPYD